TDMGWSARGDFGGFGTRLAERWESGYGIQTGNLDGDLPCGDLFDCGPGIDAEAAYFTVACAGGFGP
ncbi:hypothetical protein N9B01_04705, partial [Akkermansiaceae bacterium]|nr:hypothetical protein [Akkermansiaceae bacterium]